MRLWFAILGIILSSVVGCKKYSVECELVVQPRSMISSGSDSKTPAYLARVYAFYVTEVEARNLTWIPASYEDAEAGLITHRGTGEVRTHGLAGGQGDDTYVRLTLTRSPAMLVAVDPVNRMYAYRAFKYEIPLHEPLYVPVTFKVYQSAAPYKENEWTVTK